MYSCIGSYLCRAWTLFHLEFRAASARPPGSVALSVAIYANFFSAPLRARYALGTFHRGRRPLRPHTRLFQSIGSRIAGCRCCRGWCYRHCLHLGGREHRHVHPDVALSEPTAAPGRSCSAGKFGSWFLLLIISYALVALINAPRQRRGEQLAARGLAVPCARTGSVAICSGLRCVYAADAVPEPASPRPFCWLARMLCHSAATLRCVSGAIRQWP